MQLWCFLFGKNIFSFLPIFVNYTDYNMREIFPVILAVVLMATSCHKVVDPRFR